MLPKTPNVTKITIVERILIPARMELVHIWIPKGDNQIVEHLPYSLRTVGSNEPVLPTGVGSSCMATVILTRLDWFVNNYADGYTQDG